MELGGRWIETQGVARQPAPPLPWEYQAHHLYSAEPAHHPQLLHQHQPPQHQHLQPLPNSYYYPDSNPSFGASGSAAESVTLLRLPPPDRPAPISYASHGGYYDGLRHAPYAFAGGGQPPPSVATPGGGLSASAPSSYYYGGGGGAEPHGFAVKEAIWQHGVDPSSYAAGFSRRSHRLDSTLLGPARTPYHNFLQSHPSSKLIVKGRKGMKKTTKVVRSAYCEVCKIQCDTEEVLKCHKQGKKHKNNLQKLQESITAKPATTVVTNLEKTDASVEKDKAAGERSKRKDVPATMEELEEKKRRVLEGGAAADGVKVCTICNVVVNSPKVFEYHLSGQKHAAMVKKQQEQQNTSGN